MTDAIEILAEAIGAALRIADPHMDSRRRIDAIENALRAESARLYEAGRYDEAARFQRAASILRWANLTH